MAKEMAKSQSERTHRTQIVCLGNDVEKIQIVEEMEEIYEGGDKKSQSQTPTVDGGEKDVRKLSTEKGKGKRGNFFEKVNRILF